MVGKIKRKPLIYGNAQSLLSQLPIVIFGVFEVGMTSTFGFLKEIRCTQDCRKMPSSIGNDKSAISLVSKVFRWVFFLKPKILKLLIHTKAL